MSRDDPPGDFAERLLRWWADHGRHDLPWQVDRTPYRVWVSEIMLQQTRAGTVVGYFERFMDRFPSLPDLARASLDDVLALWSGLGYYARARNLHQAARLCVAEHGGDLPERADALRQLPGIGESTANAVIAQAHDRRAPILDGNVKRVLARHAGIGGWPGRAAVLNQLWTEAEARTPPDRAADYTQAIMDLGAMICTPRKPACVLCPVQGDCRARIEGRVESLPGRKPKRERPLRSSTWLIIRDPAGRVLLVRRPPAGIWGGLWCLPEAGDAQALKESDIVPAIQHEFSHFRLHMRFVGTAPETAGALVADTQSRWFEIGQALEAGLPRPIRQVIESLAGRLAGRSQSQTDA
ncbi:MAG: A/G-specific adenine glycosylase [Wenzhouxiangella sp.]|nr:MAG: A/G-specific adenine glycosylase [Wenzhouxiangella sp.]